MDLILTNRDEMIEGLEVVGESYHVILEFIVMQTQATEQSLTSIFNKLRVGLGSIPWMENL